MTVGLKYMRMIKGEFRGVFRLMGIVLSCLRVLIRGVLHVQYGFDNGWIDILSMRKYMVRPGDLLAKLLTCQLVGTVYITQSWPKKDPLEMTYFLPSCAPGLTHTFMSDNQIWIISKKRKEA